jgi:hypothetical protein
LLNVFSDQFLSVSSLVDDVSGSPVIALAAFVACAVVLFFVVAARPAAAFAVAFSVPDAMPVIADAVVLSPGDLVFPVVIASL